MDVALAIRQGNSKHPKQVEVNKIKFKREGDKPQRDETVDEYSNRSMSMWRARLAALGDPRFAPKVNNNGSNS